MSRLLSRLAVLDYFSSYSEVLIVSSTHVVH